MSAADYGQIGPMLGQQPAGVPSALQGLGPSPDTPEAQQADPLSSLQDAIHSVTAAMVALPDPQDTQDAAQALTILARIQTRQMRGAGAAPQG